MVSVLVVANAGGGSPLLCGVYYGLNPKIDFEPDIRVDNPEEDQACTLAYHLSEIHDLIKSEISFAQDQQQEYTNRHQLPTPACHPGDTV
jgi:hypothetical protein